MKEDLRFKERDTRKKNRKELTPLLENVLVLKGTDFWVETLNKSDIPSGAILSLEDSLNQSQIDHRQTFNEIDVQGIGKVKLFNMTAKFEKTPCFVESPPPLLSQNTEDILKTLGYSIDDILQLKKSKII